LQIYILTSCLHQASSGRHILTRSYSHSHLTPLAVYTRHHQADIYFAVIYIDKKIFSPYSSFVYTRHHQTDIYFANLLLTRSYAHLLLFCLHQAPSDRHIFCKSTTDKKLCSPTPLAVYTRHHQTDIYFANLLLTRSYAHLLLSLLTPCTIR
jgi:hypothetical protein